MDALKKRQAEMKHFLIETKFNDPFLKIKITLFFVIFYLIAFTSIAQTGIGTTSPDPSAKLDVSSTNKGFLPPRVTLTSTTDNTTIPNPAIALLVYNTGNNVNISAGYYYWNGTAWTKIGNNGSILASNKVTISATITAPTTGTRTIDKTFAVDNGATKKIYLQLGYEGGVAGSGDYLFSLPTGITFNTNAGYNPIFTGTLWSPSISAMAPSTIPISGVITIAGNWNQYMLVVPYSSSQYRIVIGFGGSIAFWNSGWFATSSNTLFSGTFDIS
jgi:hypothetical protein